jgi:hypothetical protein
VTLQSFAAIFIAKRVCHLVYIAQFRILTGVKQLQVFIQERSLLKMHQAWQN